MIITGYPTETIEDFEFTRQWFQDRVQYNGTISRLFLSPAIILPGTGLERNISKYSIMIKNNNLSEWNTAHVDTNTRKKYHEDLVDFCSNTLKFNLDAY